MISEKHELLPKFEYLEGSAARIFALEGEKQGLLPKIGRLRGTSVRIFALEGGKYELLPKSEEISKSCRPGCYAWRYIIMEKRQVGNLSLTHKKCCANLYLSKRLRKLQNRT